MSVKSPFSRRFDQMRPRDRASFETAVVVQTEGAKGFMSQRERQRNQDEGSVWGNIHESVSLCVWQHVKAAMIISFRDIWPISLIWRLPFAYAVSPLTSSFMALSLSSSFTAWCMSFSPVSHISAEPVVVLGRLRFCASRAVSSSVGVLIETCPESDSGAWLTTRRLIYDLCSAQTLPLRDSSPVCLRPRRVSAHWSRCVSTLTLWNWCRRLFSSLMLTVHCALHWLSSRVLFLPPIDCVFVRSVWSFTISSDVTGID